MPNLGARRAHAAIPGWGRSRPWLCRRPERWSACW